MESVDVLWERTGNLLSINNVHNISQVQLFSFDLARESDVVFFNERARAIFLDAAVQMPWSPVDRRSNS